MAESSWNRLALAHLTGCALIAAAIFFSSPRFSSPGGGAFPAQPDIETGISVESSDAGEFELSAGHVVEAAPTEDELRQELEAALQQLKVAQLTPRCWQPLRDKQAEPARSVYRYQMAFDPNGREVARGISELRDQPSRPDVASCLRNLPIGIQLTPTGRRLDFEIDVSFGEAAD